MNKIFISYSSKNAEWVKNWLVPKIESHGVAAKPERKALSKEIEKR
jgi:hypothetical protein